MCGVLQDVVWGVLQGAHAHTRRYKEIQREITLGFLCVLGENGEGRGTYGVLDGLELRGTDVNHEAISDILVLRRTAPDHQELGFGFFHDVRQVRLVGAADFAAGACV